MLARLFNPDKDSGRVDLLLAGDWGDYQPDLDRVMVVESDGQIVGALMLRSMPFVHEFAIHSGLNSRAIAAALLNYAAAFSRAHDHREAAFIVAPSNDKMRRFVVENGAVRQHQGELYTMELK